MQNTHHNNYFFMGPKFSAYPDEQELLLFDGLEFYVVGFRQERTEEGKDVVFVKLYNDSKQEIPRVITSENFSLVKQQVNNQSCGGQCRFCCIDCVEARWRLLNKYACPIWYCCCNCFCLDPLRYFTAQTLATAGQLVCGPLKILAVVWLVMFTDGVEA